MSSNSMWGVATETLSIWAVSAAIAIILLSFVFWYCCTQRRIVKNADLELLVDSPVSGTTTPLQQQFDGSDAYSTPPPTTTSDEREFSSPRPFENRPRVLSFLFPNELPSAGNSFEGLVDRVIPKSSTLAHVGSSLPAETLRSAVNRLNDRLKYHIVTSKTHDGGGLSSIFVETLDQPLDQTGQDDVEEEAVGSSSSCDEEDEEDNFVIGDEEEEDREHKPPSPVKHHRHLDSVMVTQVEQVLRRSELFAWLPEPILKSLVRHCTVQTLGKDELLFTYGTAKPQASCLFVVSGELALVIPPHFFESKHALRVEEEEEYEDSTTTGAEKPEELIVIGQGRMINGISDFVATIVGEPAEYVGTGRVCTAQCCVAEITHNQLLRFFESFEGVREEMLLRALALLQRVVFTSIYRLTGRYASSFNTKSRPKPIKASTKTHWSEIAGETLGIAPADLIAFSKEKRRKCTTFASMAGEETPQTLLAATATGELAAPPPASFPHILSFTAKQEVINHKEGWTPALYIVLSGVLEVRTLHFAGDQVGTLQYRALRGGDVAQLAVLTKSFPQWYSPDTSSTAVEYPRNVVTVVSETAEVLKIAERDYFELLERFPDLLVLKAREVCNYISPIVHLADCATYFKLVQPTQTVVSNGQMVDGMMVILHGRVKFYSSNTSANKDKDDTSAGREYGRGAVLGESSYLTNQPFYGTLQAMRKTSLAYIPKLIVKSVTATYPECLVHIGRHISSKMFSAQKQHELGSTRNRTVAVLPVSPNVPLESFTVALKRALEAQNRKCGIITGPQQLTHKLNDSFDEMEILSRMQDVEEANSVVFYQLDAWTCNDELSKWSKLCIAQADTVLVVVNAGDKPMPCAMEKRSRAVVSSATRELVVLHVLSDSNKVTFLPQKTREWISELGQTIAHSHHIRFHPYDTELDTFHWKSDLRRLARWISGNAIGLVLGGGGARGSAHLSVLKALEHCEIPVDFVGGTSIGAFAGGLHCLTGGDYAQVETLFSRFARDMSNGFNKFRDLTFPMVAYLKGYQFNRGIVRVFGDCNIEDFWINFYCITTDLSASKELAHRNGFVWKYIRASMTLTGYLPPICDVQGDGHTHYLVDGGYIDNLPVDAMRRSLGRNGTVIAVDVQSAWKLGGENYGDELNGWWFLWRWLNPFTPTPSIPTASEIQSHLAYVSCVQRFDQSSQKWNLYIAPPLSPNLTTMGFSHAEQIQKDTYPSVLETIQNWLASEEGAKLKWFVGNAYKPVTPAYASTRELLTPPTPIGGASSSPMKRKEE